MNRLFDQGKLDELRRRREARPDIDWDAVEAGIGRSFTLLRPGGVLSLVLPDGLVFTARKLGDHG